MTLLEERMAAPTHKGEMSGFPCGEVGNPACGDVLRLWVDVADKIVRRASFESFGSPYQLATASVLCDCVSGQTVQEARERGPRCILKRLPELPERHQYLARLAVEALHLALDVAESGASPATPPRRTLVDEEDATALVTKWLAQGELATVEVEARAADAKVLLPVSTGKFLDSMRRSGVVSNRFDSTIPAWKWTLCEAPAR